jgi:hypothetical protein
MRDDLIKCRREKPVKLNLCDGFQPIERQPNRRSNDPRLREWSINRAIGAELFIETLRHAKDPAIDSHVLTEHKDRGVAAHLRFQRVVDRLD